ncbi:MAG: 30S ribosomal protein S4 [Actinomycetota bacterium]|nr:30S ribosomal protein S4 [Actinomycetota bacterium]
MARYTGPVCKICRRESMKLFLKGERCLSDKCGFERRPYPPGEHGRGRIKESEYAKQLREKQKVKRTYGLLEKQFRGYYQKAARQKGITGENLLRLLEIRFDDVVYRAGFAFSRPEARQLVRHGHFVINGRRVDIPSYRLKVGDIFNMAPGAKAADRIREAAGAASKAVIPEWLEIDSKNLTGKVTDLPTRAQITMPVHEQLIVELYSK